MVNLRGDWTHKSRSDDHKLDSEFDFRLDSIRAEFHGELRADLDSICDQHTDMLRIYELFAEHSQRISPPRNSGPGPLNVKLAPLARQ